MTDLRMWQWMHDATISTSRGALGLRHRSFLVDCDLDIGGPLRLRRFALHLWAVRRFELNEAAAAGSFRRVAFEARDALTILRVRPGTEADAFEVHGDLERDGSERQYGVLSLAYETATVLFPSHGELRAHDFVELLDLSAR